MILKCNRTGKILWSEAEAKKHAEDVGAQDFDEVDPNQKIWVDAETGRKCFFSEAEVQRFRQRTQQPDLKVDECTVKEYGVKLASHQEKFSNHPKIIKYASKKTMDALVEVKGISVIKAEKACWFTRNGNVAKCEEWLEQNKDDPDLNKPLKEVPEDDAEHPGLSVAMDVDHEGPATSSGLTDSTATENPDFVKEKVKAELKEELMNMGFLEIRVEKACYFTENAGIPNAVQWLTDHEKDADIDFPLSKDQPAAAPAKPKLSPEEAEKRALELQQRLKRERDEREKQEEKDKEKARIVSQKQMQETQALLEEEQLKRDRQERDRLRREHEAHSAQLKEQLRLDYIERFGCEPPAEEQQEKEDITKKSAKDQMLYWMNQLRKNHKDDPRMKRVFETLKIYAGNAQKDSTNPKFLQVKKENKAFQERVAWCPEAIEIIQCLGFKDTPEFYQIQGSCCDGWLMGEAVKFLDLTIGKL